MLKDKIKQIRISKGISQRELARKINMSGQMISKIERGESDPSLDTINKIAEALEVSVSELLEKTESEKIKFKDDFDINVLEPEVMHYINNLKQILKNTFPEAQFNNALIIQNILINIMAEKSAKNAAGLGTRNPLKEFSLSDGQLLTGQKLYDFLYKSYFHNYDREWKNLFEQHKMPLYLHMVKLGENLNKAQIEELKRYYKYWIQDDIPTEFKDIFNS